MIMSISPHMRLGRSPGMLISIHRLISLVLLTILLTIPMTTPLTPNLVWATPISTPSEMDTPGTSPKKLGFNERALRRLKRSSHTLYEALDILSKSEQVGSKRGRLKTLYRIEKLIEKVMGGIGVYYRGQTVDQGRSVALQGRAVVERLLSDDQYALFTLDRASMSICLRPRWRRLIASRFLADNKPLHAAENLRYALACGCVETRWSTVIQLYLDHGTPTQREAALTRQKALTPP